ncbi:ATP-dependent DNA helicase [Pusillimonas noertemannii]|uniref:DNA excision repair protein ERCC-2 n=1 Tax=Pusillimonas noertemannii TaxID=305977 RepID=A0A2U1CHU1_9BURK|nr:ATP-dependent DNA helicase [Pusillimonas noertemannii]NYT70335.1 ATP-dependent DNA helicase [Pusillimonas noertemannii]PVY60476.1 DNA excision repair protein ERCC-2 [Pusillimonas noertemannii]TFL08028.1 ATP-dependent DNA helicase [Pusillimonas noertemannii]
MSYAVSVRTLCEFAARRGDLDLRFHLGPSAQEGMLGHRIVTARRADHYLKEIPLQAQHGALTVRGRADGFDPESRRLEEIKTYRGRLRDMPASHSALHWAQARVYGHLMCRKLNLNTIELALVYFNVATGRETIRSQECKAADLEDHFNALCGRFLAWALQEIEHRRQRDAALQALQLPFEGFRDGQRTLAKAVYRGLRDRTHHAIQAPTGIGKTMGTLFPALKAMSEQKLDKLFFLTAKTPGRKVALHALQALQGPRLMPLRVLELAAREHACEHPDKQCNGQSCPLARGFYDRLEGAREQALKEGMLDRAALRRHALRHDICPYHLGAELVPWCDLVVGDYSYYFDVGATLHAQTVVQEWRTAVLVDEAHNLVERARAMYSATLRQQDVRALLRLLPAAPRAAFGRRRTGTEAPASAKPVPEQVPLWLEAGPHDVQADTAQPAGLRNALDSLARNWQKLIAGQAGAQPAQAAPPEPLLQSLRQAAGALSDHLEQADDSTHDEALRLYFEVQHFLRMAESFGPHSLFETTAFHQSAGGDGFHECSIRNVVPAPFLEPRFQAAHACVLFSATLQPKAFYADVLGLPESTAWLDVATPFSAEQLQVRVAGGISTRYADRQASLAPMVELIAAQYARKPGNYLVFASSFDYLHRLAEAFADRHPSIALWVQSREMDEAARADFLARFDASGRGIGFAVLGGVFAEGIDLPGDRLIGAFIATLGLPQVNPRNEALKQCLEASFAGCGYDYAYLYPGLRKVVQAAGRIIRTPQDAGVVYLMDDRYNRPAVRRLLPAWWRIEQARAAPRPAPELPLPPVLSAAQGQADESARHARGAA